MPCATDRKVRVLGPRTRSLGEPIGSPAPGAAPAKAPQRDTDQARGSDDVDEFTIHGDLMDAKTNNCYRTSTPAFHWEFTSHGHVRVRGPSKQGGLELDNTYRNASHLHELIAKRIASGGADYTPTLFLMPKLY